MKKILSKIKRLSIQFLMVGFVLQMSGLVGLIPVAQAAAPAKHIVISEVQVGGGTVNDEFVELYNPDSAEVVMTGWRLTKKTATGTESNLVAEFGGTIPANGFFLIAPQSGYDGTVEPDARYSQTNNFLAPDNTVTLYSDAGTTVVDKVGMGAAGDREGTAADNPDDNGSIERRPGADYPLQGNGIDTDDNQADFRTREISDPQNSSSAPEDTKAPAPVTNLTVTDTPKDEGGSLRLTWTKSADDGAGEENVTGYNIYRRQESQPLYGDPIAAVAAGTEQFIDQNAETGISFIYQVEAVDGAYSSFAESTIAQTSADNLAPRISAQTPADQAAVADARPTISAQFTETGSGVDLSSVQLKVDNTDVTDLATVTDSGVSFVPPLNITQGSHKVDLIVADQAANSNSNQWVFTVDTVAPQVTSLAINSGAGYTKTRSVILSSAVSADARQMLVSENSNFTGADWEPYAKEKSLTLSAGYGTKSIYFQIQDRAGNLSAVSSSSITYIGSLADEDINTPDSKTLSSAETTLISDDYNAWLEISSDIQGTTFASIATYKSNPGGDLPADVTGVGDFLDFAVENSTAFPTSIRIYYTAADLAQAQVSDEGQILGLYFWDGASSSWQIYSQTGVNTVNFNGYEGFVWATVDHLTPVIIAADVTAPNAGLPIQNLRAASDDGRVDLSWDQAEDAVGYLVRYKESASATYQEVLLEGGDTTVVTITNLTNDTEYHFEVAAKDRVGNLTPFVSVTSTPQGVKVIPVSVVSAAVEAPAEELVEVEEKEEPKRISALPQVEPEKEVKGEVEEKEVEVGREDRGRLIVALVILVIAIAAGVGGYYAYEWWVSQPEKKPDQPSRKKSKKGKKSNGRW
jgi:hypothetical protein